MRKKQRKTARAVVNRPGDAPLSHQELFAKDNQPAAEPMPASVAESLQRNTLVFTSPDAGFDPRQHLRRVANKQNTWELGIPSSTIEGIPLEGSESIDPVALAKRAVRKKVTDGPFRPRWQPLIYHPKAGVLPSARRRLVRKSGLKARPLTVFNHDDRETFFPQGYPWECVGRVIARWADGSESVGTGTLVGRRTVLTAEHVVPINTGIVSVSFEPGYYFPAVAKITGRPVLGIKSWATNIFGYTNAFGSQRIAHDLAILRLSDALGDSLGYFGYRGYDSDWEDDTRWTVVGYPWLVNVHVEGGEVVGTPIYQEAPTRQHGISVEDDDSDGDGLELEIRADLTPGNSGGPLFGFWPDGPYVIGVISAERPSYNIAAGGATMTRLARHGRTFWV